jgi:hypothetical protein
MAKSITLIRVMLFLCLPVIMLKGAVWSSGHACKSNKKGNLKYLKIDG